MHRREFLKIAGTFLAAGNHLPAALELAKEAGVNSLFAGAPPLAYLRETLAPVMAPLQLASRLHRALNDELVAGLKKAKSSGEFGTFSHKCHEMIDSIEAAENQVHRRLSPDDHHNLCIYLSHVEMDCQNRIAGANILTLQETPESLISRHGGEHAQNLRRLKELGSENASQALWEHVYRPEYYEAVQAFAKSLPASHPIAREIRANIVAYRERLDEFREIFAHDGHLQDYLNTNYFTRTSSTFTGSSSNPEEYRDYLDNPNSPYRRHEYDPAKKSANLREHVDRITHRLKKYAEEESGIERPLSDFYTPVPDEKLNLELLRIAVALREESRKNKR